MVKLEFPKNFLWGVASSALQTEGENNKINKSCWDEWYKNDKQAFFEEIGPNKTCLTYTNYETDVQLMHKLNINSFRTSIQWARLIKDFKTAEVDNDGLNFYLDYFTAKKFQKELIFCGRKNHSIKIRFPQKYKFLN